MAVCVRLVLLTCSCSTDLPHAAKYSSSYGVMMHWGQGWRAVALKAFWLMWRRDGNCLKRTLAVSVRVSQAHAWIFMLSLPRSSRPVYKPPVMSAFFFFFLPTLLFAPPGEASSMFMKQRNCPLVPLWVHLAPSGGRHGHGRHRIFWLPQDCVKLWAWVTVELAILLNLTIHYSSNGGPAPSRQSRYCIGSRIITRRLHYLLPFIVTHIYEYIYLYNI